MGRIDYNGTEKFLTDITRDCKDMLRYLYADDKYYSKQLKGFKKDIKEMKDAIINDGIMGLIEK